MAFKRKEIDRVAVLRFLGGVYALTATGYGKVSLKKHVQKTAPIKNRASDISKAMINTGLVYMQGYAAGTKYKWNLKDYGPPSLLIVDMLLNEMRYIRNKRVNEINARKRNRQHLESLKIDNGIEND